MRVVLIFAGSLEAVLILLKLNYMYVFLLSWIGLCYAAKFTVIMSTKFIDNQFLIMNNVK